MKSKIDEMGTAQSDVNLKLQTAETNFTNLAGQNKDLDEKMKAAELHFGNLTRRAPGLRMTCVLTSCPKQL